MLSNATTARSPGMARPASINRAIESDRVAIGGDHQSGCRWGDSSRSRAARTPACLVVIDEANRSVGSAVRLWVFKRLQVGGVSVTDVALGKMPTNPIRVCRGPMRCSTRRKSPHGCP